MDFVRFSRDFFKCIYNLDKLLFLTGDFNIKERVLIKAETLGVGIFSRIFVKVQKLCAEIRIRYYEKITR